VVAVSETELLERVFFKKKAKVLPFHIRSHVASGAGYTANPLGQAAATRSNNPASQPTSPNGLYAGNPSNPPNLLTHITLNSPHRHIECLAVLRSRAAMGALAPRLPGHGLSDLARKIAPHQALAIDAVWILGTSMMLTLLCVSILI